MGEGLGTYEAGKNIGGAGGVGTGGGNTSMLEASMAIMSFNASQQQQQQLMNASCAGLLELQQVQKTWCRKPFVTQ